MRILKTLPASSKNTANFLLAVSVSAFVSAASMPVSANTDAGLKIASTEHCPPFENSTLFREPVKTTTADPTNWVQHIENAADGEEILLQDGHYPLEQYSVVINHAITLRSASGNNESVVIEGQGNSENAEALMIMANDVHIADITVKNTRDHGITIQEGFAQPVIYNLHLIDIGTQHIKGNRPGPNGTIACSQLGYSTPISQGDYNGAIDIHRAVNWTIRDNYIYNIYGDGSGCIVDTDCGSMWPGGEPAVLLWKDSKDNTIERNTIVDSYRAIALGLDTPYSGGLVKDNFICRSTSGKEGVNGFIEGDAGISLSGASDVNVVGNRIVLPGDYPGQIEIRDGTGITLENNILSKKVWDRGNSEYQEQGTVIYANFSVGSCQKPESLLVAALANEPTEDKDTKTDLPSQEIELLIPDSIQAASIPADQIATLQHSVEQAPEQTTAVVVAETDASLIHRAMLLDIRQERLLAMEERLLATEERLKAMEERLIFLEQRQVFEQKIVRLEQLLQASEHLLK